MGGPELANIMLYLRKRSVEQMNFMTDRIAMKDGFGLIHGQPGIVKSTTAFLKALTLAVVENKIVLWIHVDKRDRSKLSYQVVRLHGRDRRQCELSSVACLIGGDWGLVNDTSERVLFIDGYSENDADVPKQLVLELSAAAVVWYARNKKMHHLFILSSMGTATVLNSAARVSISEKRFCQWSWGIEEYLNALKDPGFRGSIAPRLGDIHATPERNLEAKFYYAGGCARYMFQLSTAEVKDELDLALQKQADLSHLTKALRGNYCPDLTLIGLSERDFVSLYVRHCIAKKTAMGPLLECARTFQSNLSMSGWIFEEFFFSALWTAPGPKLDLVDLESTHPQVSLSKGTQLWIEFSPDYPVAEKCPTDEWLRPRKFNQGGFDAVYLDSSTATAIFVRCTIAASHALKLEFCKKFLKEASHIFQPTRIQFFFIVPISKLPFFDVPRISRGSPFRNIEIKARGVAGWITDRQ